MVEVVRYDLTTPWSQTKCSTRLSYTLKPTLTVNVINPREWVDIEMD